MSIVGNLSRLFFGSNEAAQVLIKTTTLTNAQIKDLPITPITLVSAPGSGLMLLPLTYALFAKTSAGAYTNINVAAFLKVGVASGQSFSYIPNDAAITNGSTTLLSDILGVAANNFIQGSIESATEDVDQWGPLGVKIPTATATNSPIIVDVDNVGSLSFTGGNAANTVTIVVFYVIVTVP